MERTQIYLGSKHRALLDNARKSSGASRSELIRRLIEAAYDKPDKEAQIAAIRAAAGLWKDRKFTTDEYIRAVRGGDLGSLDID
ncbi:MAG: CopG family transcriptional regulator [Dehalococcoidia bacterium]